MVSCPCTSQGKTYTLVCVPQQTHSFFNFPSCLPKDECYDPIDSLEISLFIEIDDFYDCGHDANMIDTYGDELPTVPYVQNENFPIAPTHDSPIILLNSPTTL